MGGNGDTSANVSKSGMDPKLLYKKGSRGVSDNPSNGYLVKSAKNTVIQNHNQQAYAAQQQNIASMAHP